MKYNLKLLPKEILIELLNKETGKSLVSKNIVFDNPINITGDNRNTLLVVYPKSYNNFSGTFSFKYNRLDIRDYITNNKKITINHEKKVSEIVNTLNKDYNLNLTKDDYYDNDLPPMEYGDIIKLKIVMRPNSYIWLNTLNLITKKLPLFSEVFPKTILDGFWPPTDIKKVFKKTKLNGFGYFDEALEKRLFTNIFSKTKLDGFDYFNNYVNGKYFVDEFKNTKLNGLSSMY